MIAAKILSGEKFSFRSVLQEAKTCQLIKSLYGDRWLDIRHEDLIAEPALNVSKLISFLGLQEDPHHLEVSIAHLNFKPNHRRGEIKWEQGMKRKIKKKLIGQFDSFEGYEF